MGELGWASDREAVSVLPEKFNDLLETLELIPDRADRIQALISLANQFRAVGPEVAERPFGEEHRVPGCESEAFVWVVRRADGGLGFEYAVENPQGVSAMAMAVILQQGLEGESAEAVQAVPDEVVYRIFGRELSMGKSMGLMGMVQLTKALARQVGA